MSNADAAEPDSEEGCDVARIISLYEDSTNQNDPFRAKVQWYSRPTDIPSKSLNNTEPVNFCEREVLEDCRPFNSDVSIETFHKKCSVMFTEDTDLFFSAPYHYICRYRLMPINNRKCRIEPVIEKEIQVASPAKSITSPKTPMGLVKRMSGRVLSTKKQKNWSVSNTDSTILLLKRAILADKMDKYSPKLTSKKKLSDNVIIELLTSNDALKGKAHSQMPTLIIRQSRFSLKSRRSSKTNEVTLKKVLFDETQMSPYAKRLGRSAQNKISFAEEEISPVKQTKRRSAQNKISFAEEEISPVKQTKRKTRSTTESEQSDSIHGKTPKKALFKENQNSPVTTRSGRVVKIKRYSIEDEVAPKPKIQSDKDLKPATEISVESIEEANIQKTPGKTTPKRAKKFSQSDDDQNTPVKRIFRRAKKVSQSDDDQNTPKRTSRMAREASQCHDDQNTPKRGRKVSQSDDDFKPTPKPPNTQKTSRTPVQTRKAKRVRKIISQLTPSLQPRARPIEITTGFVKESKSLPGRENHLYEIQSFVRSRIEDETSGCMYISGVPGTGKTATVCAALNILKDDEDLPAFQVVEVNAVKITEPTQAYVIIYKQLTGKTVAWDKACALLYKRFTKPGPRRMPTVLFVDELDVLFTRRQDVLYSIVEWARHDTAMLTVLAVANSMDMPERNLVARVASRLGLTCLDFPPYTHTQLQTIMATRLAGTNITPDALQLITRKVAAVSGDARRVLALCARAQELSADSEEEMDDVTDLLACSSDIMIVAVRCAAPAERLMMHAIAQEVERTGSDETTLSRALLTAGDIMYTEGRRPYKSAVHIRPPTYSQGWAICSRLAASGLLLIEPRPAGHKLMLNMTVDDVYRAIKEVSE